MQEVKKPKKPLIYYYFIVMIALIMVNLLLMPRIAEQEIKQVDYGTFIDMAEDGKIGEVQVNQQSMRYCSPIRKTLWYTRRE